jgi:hypothetical protein
MRSDRLGRNRSRASPWSPRTQQNRDSHA